MHDLIGRILGQQYTGQQIVEKKRMKPQTEEQRGKRACSLTARGSISKAMKGSVDTISDRSGGDIPDARRDLRRHGR